MTENPLAEIFSQGEEVVTGQIADTNAAWLSERLVEMGFVIKRHTAVGDNLADLIALLKEISQRADVCICTGGLGPTVDDLTAEAVAKAFDCPLQLDQQALQQIKQYFENRRRGMADSNRKQAFFPQGALRIDNAWGTAPGFSIKQNHCWFVFVPGVPTEMRHIFYDSIKQQLQQRFQLRANKRVAIKTIGIGEADLQQKLNGFSLPADVQLSFRAVPDEVQTKLMFPGTIEDQQIKKCVKQCVEMLGDVVFAVDEPDQAPRDLVVVIDQIMRQKKLTLSVIETASHGLLAAKCIGRGWLQSSAFYQSSEGLIDAFELKKQLAPESMAEQLTTMIRKKQRVDLVLVQLYQGVRADFYDKDKIIILYNTLLTADGFIHNTQRLSGPIKRKQNQAAIRSLDLLRRYLQNSAINTIK